LSVRRLRAIVRALHREYAEGDLGNCSDPVEELVYISLTRQTHRQNAARTWDRVVSLGGPRALVRLPTTRIAQMLRDGGFARQKARWIKQSLELIRQRMGELSLRKARRWSDEKLESFLRSLPGVSIKTAKCIMLYSMGRQVLPVDTHVRRVTERIGLVPRGLSEKRIHEQLHRLIEPEHRFAFHVNVIWHGRRVCTALRPRCHACSIRRHCAFGRRQVRGV
jgi:endonuclease III